MRQFARLFQRLDETTKTSDKVSAMVEYFAGSSNADAAYALYFLLGHKIKPSFPTRMIRQAAARSAKIPDWLFEESYHWVGDLAETAASMACGVSSDVCESLSQTVEQRLIPLLELARSLKKNLRKTESGPDSKASKEDGTTEEPEDRVVEALMVAWSRYDSMERFVFNKLLTGNLRVGVSAKLVTRALGLWCGLPAEELTHRLMGQWEPSETFFRQTIALNYANASPAKPYPFCLAHPLPENDSVIHSASDYLAEWKWDGIRCQLIHRSGLTFLWSRGEELLDGRFPEIQQAARGLPDGLVLDGEILAFHDNAPLAFALLQKRIQRKNPSAKILTEIPVIFLAFDVLEHDGKDLRNESYQHRRGVLETLRLGLDSAPKSIRCNETFVFDHWQEMFHKRDQARSFGAEGLMLKHRHSRYEVGRVTGAWWKSKVTPYTVDAVLVYAQRGHGRRAGLFSDYTFAVWDQDRLVPFAKAYSGLTNEEISRLDRWIKENTTQRFGPVHEVPPKIVMELAFENLQESSRHKSGIAVRFPRILRWREDKSPAEADRLELIKELLKGNKG